MELVPGALVVDGRFRLVRALGEGGMGVVWHAVELSTETPRALKFVRSDKSDPTLAKRFLREARAAMAVRHPNIVTITELASSDDGSPVIVFELLRGETLDDCLARVHRLELPLAATILARVAAGVRAAHAAGIVHRDLKPGNIFLVDQDDETFDVRVLDFGIAKRVGVDRELDKTESLTVTGGMVGTPHYMSLEQALGDKTIDRRADVWAMGVIAFECLTGTVPVAGDTIGQIMRALIEGKVARLADHSAELPDEVVSLVDDMLVTERDGRPESLDAFHEIMLRHARGGARIEDLARGPAPEHASPTANELARTELASVRPAPLRRSNTTLEHPDDRRRPRRRWPLFGIAAAAVAMPIAWFALRAPPPPPMTSESLGLGAATSGPTPRETTAASPATAPAEAPASDASASAPIPTASLSAVARPRPSKAEPRASASASASAARSAAPSPTKLQGGVAGQVPF